jgi:mRNA interferase MazF
MKQGDIYLANLNPVRGHEQKGTRPVVIISGNTMNENLGLVIVCPITSKIKNYFSCIFLKKNKVNNLACDCEIITFQIRTISAERLVKRLGKIGNDELEKVFEGLNMVMRY